MKQAIFFLLFSLPFALCNGQSKFIISGGVVVMKGPADLVLEDTKFTNNGSFNQSGGSVLISGDAATAESCIAGSSTSSFYNLKVNKSANNARLAQGIEIQNLLSLSGGNLELADFDLTFQPNGSYALSNGSYVETTGSGVIKQSIPNGESKTFPLGNERYTPVTISNDVSATSDIFSVRAINQVLIEGASGSQVPTNVVNKTWFISEATPGGSLLSMVFSWNALDEATGFDRSQAWVTHFINNAWDMVTPSAAIGSNPYSLSRSGITSLSPFAIVNAPPVPVELVRFWGSPKAKDIELNWLTATEINNDRFVIEHSTDGLKFEAIGEKKGAGNSSLPNTYSFLHLNPPTSLNYYQLKQIDFDGSFSYSNIIGIDLENTISSQNKLLLFPNPGNHIVNLRLLNGGTIESIQVYDAYGSLVLQQSSGNNSLNIAQLSPGMYWVKAQGGGQQYNSLFSKQ